jgi:hypothetical protein
VKVPEHFPWIRSGLTLACVIACVWPFRIGYEQTGCHSGAIDKGSCFGPNLWLGGALTSALIVGSLAALAAVWYECFTSPRVARIWPIIYAVAAIGASIGIAVWSLDLKHSHEMTLAPRLTFVVSGALIFGAIAAGLFTAILMALVALRAGVARGTHERRRAREDGPAGPEKDLAGRGPGRAPIRRLLRSRE